MTEAHLHNLLTTLNDAARALNVGLTGNLAAGVLEARKAFKDLWDERDDADRRAGAAARKIHQLQRQLDKLHEKKASAKKRRPWPRRAV